MADMLKAALLLAGKDLRLILGAGRRSGVFLPAQVTLLGLLVIFLFSLAPDLNPDLTLGLAPQGNSVQGAPLSPGLAAILFWVVSLLAQTLIFQRLYGLEQTGGVRLALLTAPSPPQAVWLGKTLAGLALLVLVQAVLCPALILLLRQELAGPFWPTLAGTLLADLGLAALGALLGAFSAAPDRHTGRAALPAILSLPLLIPPLLAAAKLCLLSLVPAVAAPTPEATSCLSILAAFDGLAIAAALVLFPFIFKEE